MVENWPTESTGSLNITVLLGLLALLTLVGYVYCCTCLMIIARKTGDPSAGLAWIPIINVFTLLKAAGKSPAWFLLLLIPGVNLICMALLWCSIAERRGRAYGTGFIILVPLLGMLLPAWLAAGPPVGPAAGGNPVRPTRPAAAPGNAGASRGSSVFCSNCGDQTNPGDRFCGSCGQPIGGTTLTAPAAASGGAGAALAAVVVVVLLLAMVGAGGFVWSRMAAPTLATTPASPPMLEAPAPPTPADPFPSEARSPEVIVDIQPDGSRVYSGEGAIEKAIFDVLQTEVDKIRQEQKPVDQPKN